MVDGIEARVIKEGKDPLAEGNTLYNPVSDGSETHYEVGELSSDVIKAEKEGVRKAKEYQLHQPQSVAARPARRVMNKSETDLAEAIKSSKRTGR